MLYWQECQSCRPLCANGDPLPLYVADTSAGQRSQLQWPRLLSPTWRISPLDQPSGTLLSCELRRSPWYLILLAIAPGKSPQTSHQSVSWRLSRLDLKSFVFFLLPRLERTNYPSTLYKNFAFSFYCALSINRYIISFFCQYSPCLSSYSLRHKNTGHRYCWRKPLFQVFIDEFSPFIQCRVLGSQFV